MDPYVFNQIVHEHNLGAMLVDAWRIAGWIAGGCTLIGIGLDVLRRVKQTTKNGAEVHTVKVSIRAMPYMFAILWGFIFVYFTWWMTRR